jgi:hypothetical protein
MKPTLRRAFDARGEFDARADSELRVDVAQVRLDGLEAEEELGSDLGVGLPIDDEPCELELALRKRGDPDYEELTCVLATPETWSERELGLMRFLLGDAGVLVRWRLPEH